MRHKNKDDIDIIAFVDNDSEKIGTYVESVPIISPQNIFDFEFDIIVISVFYEKFIREISRQLINYGINKEKIKILAYTDFSFYDEYTDARVI